MSEEYDSVFDGEEKVNTILPLDLSEDNYLILATRKGLIKKTKIQEFDNIRKKHSNKKVI